MSMTKPTSEQVTFLAAGAGASQRTALDKLRDTVSVKDFGAVGDGVTDDTVAIQAAMTASDNVMFPNGTYLVTSAITKIGNDVSVDFGTATIVNGGVLYPFVFGTLSDTPQNVGLCITGGRFTQATPATSSNYNYILVQAVRKFVIDGCNMDNVSNGGITVYAGATDGVISNVTINGKTNCSTVRGIWLAGSTASDYAANLVDTNSISRNATAVPIYAINNVRIVNCKITLDAYGVYMMNTRDCSVENCMIDISGDGAKRCLAINTYSPRCRVIGNTFVSDRSSTGILVTQVSTDVIISNNIFLGTFGGNRAVYVQYLASALITGNRFADTSTQSILIDVGGFAVVRGNEFFRSSYTAGVRCVRVTAIDAAAAGTLQGSTATVVPNSGVIFDSNTTSNYGICVAYQAYAASNGNVPAAEAVIVTNNVMRNLDVATEGTDRIISASVGDGSHSIMLRNERNVAMPLMFGDKMRPTIAGTSFIHEATQVSIAAFEVDNQASAGALTSTRVAGNAFSMSATRSGSNLVLTPRTQFGQTGFATPIVLGITDGGGSTLPRTYVVTPSGSTYIVQAYDSTGTQLDFSVVGIKFRVLLGPIGSGS